MVHLLSQEGCDVSVARTGELGMELAQESKFDLITLDADLPDINGLEVCRKLKRRHHSRHTPVVFVSTCCCEQDVQRGLEAGAVDYIAKPFDTLGFTTRLLSYIHPASPHE